MKMAIWEWRNIGTWRRPRWEWDNDTRAKQSRRKQLREEKTDRFAEAADNLIIKNFKIYIKYIQGEEKKIWEFLLSDWGWDSSILEKKKNYSFIENMYKLRIEKECDLREVGSEQFTDE